MIIRHFLYTNEYYVIMYIYIDQANSIVIIISILIKGYCCCSYVLQVFIYYLRIHVLITIVN